MALICEDGLSECTGCNQCLITHEKCDDCHRPFSIGDKYYNLYRKTVCEGCTEEPSDELCTVCKKTAAGGINYKGFVLCRSCSGIATGYYGYI